MIVLERPSWWRLVTVWSGSALQRMWRRLGVTTLIAVLVTVLHTTTPLDLGVLTPAPFTIVGLALGIFLGFRNNTSYDRFWEGRKLWGELVNTARSFAREVLMLVDANRTTRRPTPLQREMIHGVVAFVHSLCQHLRDVDDLAAYRDLVPAEDRDRVGSVGHRPNAVLDALGALVRRAWQEGRLDTLHAPVLESGLAALTSVLGGCERIRNTPIPTSYTSLIHRIVGVYVLGLPFGFVGIIGAYTPVLVLFTAYAFFGLDAIGDELENPFGTDANDLPLAALTRHIEINLREMLGETDLPPPLLPQDHVLL